ncbi:hypothetical protein GPECTOR_4g985 [Gonium pectorale]|uniref:Uncharacterized protein n=1 Tax=Gonium pectorale TaxID=33097 RepID=A0A150GYT6_GONPE|nr:hypothetical protein GPECTOR_4g985 [Gonium pectorale]|eukprot:KXZ54913.1 hypothetical protein GPECTOR_4g985 [Gonium pectorale]
MPKVGRRRFKRSKVTRSDRRYCFSLLNRALSRWLAFVEARQRQLSMLKAAELLYGHNVLQRWHRAAARSRELKRGVAALQVGSSTRRLSASFARWRAFLLHRRQSVLAERLASEHHRGALLWRCLCAWLRLAQASAARQLHIKGMREYQRMMQARADLQMLRQQLEGAEQRLAETSDKLADAQQRMEVQAGEVSLSSLEKQAAALQQSVLAAQDCNRELGLKLQQQAAGYEEQLLAARDEAALARREASSLAAAAARFEQQATDVEAQLQVVRAANESLVTTLRQPCSRVHPKGGAVAAGDIIAAQRVVIAALRPAIL